MFHSTLIEIKDKIEPIVIISTQKHSEKDAEVKKENSHESRWETDAKMEVKTEPSDKSENTIVIQE